MTPLSVGLRLAVTKMVGATKAHDEQLQCTQVPPRPRSRRALLARCSLRISRHLGFVEASFQFGKLALWCRV
jgi:hypothetical protein